MNSAKVVPTIITQSVRGSGQEDSPLRVVTEYWALDGTKLSENDPLSVPKILNDLRAEVDNLVGNCTAIVSDHPDVRKMQLQAQKVYDLNRKCK